MKEAKRYYVAPPELVPSEHYCAYVTVDPEMDGILTKEGVKVHLRKATYSPYENIVYITVSYEDAYAYGYSQAQAKIRDALVEVQEIPLEYEKSEVLCVLLIQDNFYLKGYIHSDELKDIISLWNIKSENHYGLKVKYWNVHQIYEKFCQGYTAAYKAADKNIIDIGLYKRIESVTIYMYPSEFILLNLSY